MARDNQRLVPALARRATRCAVLSPYLLRTLAHLLLVAAAFAAPARAAEWTQDAYVWQRDAAGTALTSAISASRDSVAAFHVLAAEVSWRAGKMEIARPSGALATLAVAAGKPIGLVLRVGPFAGEFRGDDETSRALVRLAREIIIDTKSAGVDAAELQIDFDCAESKLDGYRTWLVALRAALPRNTPLIVTVLPVWLRHRDSCAALVAATDGFVLQVHSLEKPAGPDAPFTLCDPAKARAWVADAATFGVPFRVALPTYGYALTFDAAGNFVSLSAEAPSRPAPAGGSRRIVLADAVAMSALARDLRAAPAENCRGLIWFRLPVAGDRLNWTWPTLARVMRGETPVVRLEAVVDRADVALLEIAIANTGETTEIFPGRVELSWSDEATLQATDGLSGFRLVTREAQRQATIELAPSTAGLVLAPGERRKVAWLRFAHAPDLAAHLVLSR